MSPGENKTKREKIDHPKWSAKLFSKFAISLSLLVFASSAHAQDVQSCGEIENDLDRLACYNAAVGRTPVSSVETTDSKWVVRTEKSDFDDTTNVFMSVNSNDEVFCGYAGSEKITLVARCVENTTSLIIATHCHVASEFGGYGEVEYRIDQKPSSSKHFTESTNNRALGLWNGSRSIPVIKSMFGGDELLIRFTPYNENPVVARFPIAGLEQAIAPLRDNCNW